MQTLNYFRTEKSNLLSAYQAIQKIDPDILNRIDRTPGWINTCTEELIANRFKLFVAGQMNCGKSTLINALLFGRIILPVYDAVMTSSITLIEHSKQNPDAPGQEGFRVAYYSAEEWSQIRQQMEDQQDDGRAKVEFERAVSLARERGAIAHEFIGKQAELVVGLDALPEYVTPVHARRKGKYTPFVKAVTLYVDNPILNDLMVVDTPGTNDPNEQRARLTEDWIRMADAVVFVTYAGQAMPAQDVDFINRFMLHVPSTHRIIAVNKVDAIDNLSELNAYIESLRQDPREAIKQVFDVETPLVQVSALGGLIANYQGELPTDLLEDRSRLEPLDYLETSKHGIENLRKTIEERLLKNKGEYLLRAHQEKITSTFELARMDFENQIATIEERMLHRAMSARKLSEEQARINDKKNSVMELAESLKEDLEYKINEELLKSKNSQIPLIEEMTNDLQTEIKNSSIKEIKIDIEWLCKKYIEKCVIKYAESAKDTWGNILKTADEQLDQYKCKLNLAGVISEKKISISIDRTKLLNLAKTPPNVTMTAIEANAFITNAQGKFSRIINSIFSTNIDVSDVRSETKKKIRQLLEDILKNSLDHFSGYVDASRGKLLDTVSDDLQNELKKMSEMLHDIQKETDQDENQKNKDRAARSELSEKLEHLQSLRFSSGY